MAGISEWGHYHKRSTKWELKGTSLDMPQRLIWSFHHPPISTSSKQMTMTTQHPPCLPKTIQTSRSGYLTTVKIKIKIKTAKMLADAAPCILAIQCGWPTRFKFKKCKIPLCKLQLHLVKLKKKKNIAQTTVFKPVIIFFGTWPKSQGDIKKVYKKKTFHFAFLFRNSFSSFFLFILFFFFCFFCVLPNLHLPS